MVSAKSAVVALAGRRIDSASAKDPRFPFEPLVRSASRSQPSSCPSALVRLSVQRPVEPISWRSMRRGKSVFLRTSYFLSQLNAFE
jgi:hypothetical protein